MHDSAYLLTPKSSFQIMYAEIVKLNSKVGRRLPPFPGKKPNGTKHFILHSLDLLINAPRPHNILPLLRVTIVAFFRNGQFFVDVSESLSVGLEGLTKVAFGIRGWIGLISRLQAIEIVRRQTNEFVRSSNANIT